MFDCLNMGFLIKDYWTFSYSKANKWSRFINVPTYVCRIKYALKRKNTELWIRTRKVLHHGNKQVNMLFCISATKLTCKEPEYSKVDNTYVKKATKTLSSKF